jgi:hypothetical protein
MRSPVIAASRRAGSVLNLGERERAEPDLYGRGGGLRASTCEPGPGAPHQEAPGDRRIHPDEATPTRCPWASARTPKLVPGTV